MSMGLDPAYAVSVASMMSHNPFGKQQSVPPIGTPDTTPPLPAAKTKSKAAQPGIKRKQTEQMIPSPRKRHERRNPLRLGGSRDSAD